MEYDAELHNVSFSGYVAYGEIFNDTKNRWPDGTFIRTSVIQEFLDNDVVETMNTKYKIVSVTGE